MATMALFSVNAQAQAPRENAVAFSRSEFLKRVNDGVPCNLPHFDLEIEALESIHKEIVKMNRTIRRRSANRCRVFLDALESSTRQSLSAMRSIRRYFQENPKAETDLAALYRNRSMEVARLQILFAVNSSLYTMAERNTEAGFGILQPEKTGKQCEVADRELWKSALRVQSQSLAKATFALIGTPGIKQMRMMDEALASSIHIQEASETLWNRVSLLGEIGLAIWTWRYAPTVFKMVGLGERMVQSPSLALGGRVGSVAAESIALGYIYNQFLFTESTILRERTDSIEWGELMYSLESILGSPMHSPRLYLDALSQIYGDISSRLLLLIYSDPNSSSASQLQREIIP